MPSELASYAVTFVLRCGGLWLVEVSPLSELLKSFRTSMPLNNALVVALVIASWTAMTSYFQCVWLRAQAREEGLNESLRKNVEELTVRSDGSRRDGLHAASVHQNLR